MKNIRRYFVLTFAGFISIATGCGDEKGNNTTEIQDDTEVFEKCEVGTPTVCAVDENGKAILKKCISGYLIKDECELGCNSSGNSCAVSFGDLCQGTGGRISDDGQHCVCGEITCPEGDLCVSTETETVCASDVMIGEKCINGDKKCINDSDDRGETYTCVDGRWSRDIDEDGKEIKCEGSCNSEMKQCGESGCVNYTFECRNDLLADNSGAIAICQFGKWQIQHECADGVSCMDDNNCGVCRNGSTKCEDHDIDGIMNKNCDAKGNCEKDSNDNVKNYPANIGVLLLCDNGRWSDPSDLTKSQYCPEREGTFQSFNNSNYVRWTTLMTWFYKVYSGALVHDDYHYSSCHNTSDGISECGTCSNHFNICSDENIGGYPQGHLYRCENGQIVSKEICSMKTCNINHTQCN